MKEARAKEREKREEEKSDRPRKSGFEVEVIKRRKRTAIPTQVAKEIEEEESIEEEAQKEAEAILQREAAAEQREETDNE